MDWVDSRYRFKTHRRIVVIASKTVVIVLGIGERLLETYREKGSLGKAVDFMIAKSNGQRFLGLVLLISVVVGAYLTLQEIDRAMGEGSLYRLLCQRPVDRKT